MLYNRNTSEVGKVNGLVVTILFVGLVLIALYVAINILDTSNGLYAGMQSLIGVNPSDVLPSILE